MMNYSIADALRQAKSEVPESWRYVDPSEICVRTAAPKWTWVARACHEIPVGKCVLFPVPKGMPLQQFMNQLRCSLQAAKSSRLDKFSVRRSKFEDYVVVMKTGTWAGLYREMESAGMIGAAS